jgi:hypothetical protein
MLKIGLASIKRAVFIILSFILDPRKVVDYLAGRENLVQTREEVKEKYQESYSPQNLESSREGRQQVIGDLSKFSNMARTQIDSSKVALAVMGLLVYYVFSFRILVVYATLFGLEAVMRKHVIDVISYEAVFDSDDDQDLLFKHLWNSRMLDTPQLHLVVVAAAARRWNRSSDFINFMDEDILDHMKTEDMNDSASQ